MAVRTLTEKVADIKSTYEQFAELLTSPDIRAILSRMNSEGAQAAAQGDPAAYVAAVQASLTLQRVVSANDRAALIAATMAAGAGGTRVIPLEDGD